MVTRDFPYDAFLSYRHREPDQGWVRGVLLPRLKAAGLKICIDIGSFRLGAPLVREMGRAVEESRYSVAVLSPAYLESAFTDFEATLSEHLGLEESSTRLLLLVREPCQPRLSLRFRFMLEMGDADVEAGLARLIDQLREPPTQ